MSMPSDRSIRRALCLVALLAALAANDSRAASIREVKGKHFTLVTDVASSPAVDGLPDVFDQALPQWRTYFQVDADKEPDWQVTGYLIQSRERFEQAGLIPKDLPKFRNGFSHADKFWFNEQTSEYYRRHLMLHEGTHCFMVSFLGGMGPPWYAEGMAELMATHRWSGGKLTLNYYPRDVAEVPRLGRIKLVQDAFQEARALTLPKVMAYDDRAHLENEPYGWCWAAAAALDNYPRYRDRFRALAPEAAANDFTERLQTALGDDWPLAQEEWQVFIANIEHGYDFARMAIDFKPGAPLKAGAADVRVAADRGWQSSVRLEAGHTYRLTASGRYQLAKEPQPWMCEPGGVTVEYYHGQPLGVLLAAVRSDRANPAKISPLIKPIVIGLTNELQVGESGTLYLRINDSAGKLADNSGSLRVKIVDEAAADTATKK
jgi:hypothetical protein